jgi:methyl-accepting chemotaxis protein
MPERGTRKRDPIDTLDLQVDFEDLALDREQVKQLAAIRRLIRREMEKIVADLSGINSALSGLSAQITQLADQVAALSAGQVTQDELDQIASQLNDAAAAVDAIVEPDAGEDPVEPQP